MAEKNNGRRWSQQDISLLKELYPDNKTSWVAEKLGRTAFSINAKSFLLKIKKSDEFIKKMLSGGAAFRFEKNHVAWNKGKRIDEYLDEKTIEKIKETSFKKGHLPANTKESDGEVTVRMDKRGINYKWIREGIGKWKMLHVKMYEDVYGKTPENYIVVFKNKNTMDCRIENLEMITRSENMLRNSIQNYPAEVKETMFLIKKLNRYIDGKEQNC
jgi:hypothetical protein